MSQEAHSVAISIGEDALLGDSADGILLGDSPRPQQQEITIDHGPHTCIDELLKVIKGANGMPVMFVPSSNGRLAAVAVDGLQNLMPANRGSAEKKQQDFRSWLLLLASLVATVTFAAALNPPGGFWAVDDKANGYIAGTSVMRDKFRNRYRVFYYSNTTAFFASFMVIGMLAKNKEATVMNNVAFRTLVGLCFLSLGGSYVAGTSVKLSLSLYSTAAFLGVSVYMSLHWFLDWIAPNPLLRKLACCYQ